MQCYANACFFIYSLCWCFVLETTGKSVHCGVVWWPASCCTQDSMSVVKQLKRPVAVIPQCSYPETRSLETAGMSSFSPSLFQTFSLLVSLSFCMSFSLSFCPFLACASKSPAALRLCFSVMHTHVEGESTPQR